MSILALGVQPTTPLTPKLYLPHLFLVFFLILKLFTKPYDYDLDKLKVDLWLA